MDRSGRTLIRGRGAAFLALLPLLSGSGCVEESPLASLKLDVHCGAGGELPSPVPSLESGPHQVTLRHLFPAEGCPTLRADLLRIPSGGYLVRVVELEEGPAPPDVLDGTSRVAYTVVISGLTPGRHHLRVVHVAGRGGAPGPLAARPRALGTVTSVFDHPVLVLGPP